MLAVGSSFPVYGWRNFGAGRAICGKHGVGAT
jgi:hypothetical protein